MKKSKLIVFLVIICFLNDSFLFADPLRFQADEVRTSFATGKEETSLRGSAYIQSGSIEINAYEIIIKGEDQRFIEANGSLSINDSEDEISILGDELLYDRIEEIIQIRGNAVLEDRKNDLLIRAQFIESRTEENSSIIQVGVRIIGEDLLARCQVARHNRDTNRLVLSGSPVVFFKGDEYRARRISIDLESDEIDLEGEVQGELSQRGN
jgi:lipopolysaccharide export system protein LptA